jgi:hypothetical protein
VNRYGTDFIHFQDPESGTTPLHLAAHEGHLACVTLLLDSGANPLLKNRDLQGKDYQTPLEIARLKFNWPVQYVATAEESKKCRRSIVEELERAEKTWRAKTIQSISTNRTGISDSTTIPHQVLPTPPSPSVAKISSATDASIPIFPIHEHARSKPLLAQLSQINARAAVKVVLILSGIAAFITFVKCQLTTRPVSVQQNLIFNETPYHLLINTNPNTRAFQLAPHQSHELTDAEAIEQIIVMSEGSNPGLPSVFSSYSFVLDTQKLKTHTVHIHIHSTPHTESEKQHSPLECSITWFAR